MDRDAILSEPLDKLLVSHAKPLDRMDFMIRLALDRRLAQASLGASEPLIAQLKLAWWRDVMAGRTAAPSDGADPLFRKIANRHDASVPAALVDGWEAIVTGDPAGHAQRAAAMFDVMAAGTLPPLARAWSLWDLWFRVGEAVPAGREAADALRDMELPAARLSRRLRPLAMLGWRIRRDRRAGCAPPWRPADWPRLAWAGVTGY